MLPCHSPEAKDLDVASGGASSLVIAKKSDMVPELGQQCDEAWTAWPRVQNCAISEGNVMVLELFASVGNLFLMLSNAIKVKVTGGIIHVSSHTGRKAVGRAEWPRHLVVSKHTLTAFTFFFVFLIWKLPPKAFVVLEREREKERSDSESAKPRISDPRANVSY